MTLVYIMLPFFKTFSSNSLQSQINQQLHLDISPEQQYNIKIHQLDQNKVAVEIPNFNIHFMQVNRVIEQNTQLHNRLQLLESVIKDFQIQQYSNNNNSTSQQKNNSNNNSHNNNQSATQNVDVLMKKLKKYKEIKEENRKLKKLLQIQLQNTQKVREQTQKTMRVLREQFDSLVTQMGKKEKYSQKSFEKPSTILFPQKCSTSRCPPGGQSQQEMSSQAIHHVRDHRQKSTTTTPQHPQPPANGKHITIR